MLKFREKWMAGKRDRGEMEHKHSKKAWTAW